MADPITGWINELRLLIDAIVSGKVEARTIQGMTDEQLDAYIARLRSEAGDAVAEGYDLEGRNPDGSPKE